MVSSRAAVLVLCWGLGATAGGCLEVHSGHRSNAADAPDAADPADAPIDTQTAGDTRATEPPSETIDSGPSEVDAPDVAACVEGQCDDGDPCTDDGCIVGQCEHQRLEGCDPECTWNGLTALAALRYGYAEGAFVKTRGSAQMRQNGLCTDNGVCMCHAGIGLVDGGTELALVPGIVDADLRDPAMTYDCRSTDSASAPSNVRVECQPLLAGVGYRVWGNGSYYEGGNASYSEGASAGEAAVPARPLASIAVQGYCLDTSNEEVLWGDYAARVTFDGGPEVSAHARIWSVDQGELLDLRADDPNDNVIGVTGGVVEQLDNGIRFEFQTREGAPSGVEYLVARLVARENRLEGRFVSTWAARGPMWGYLGIANASRTSTDGAPQGDAIYRPMTSGTIVLVRLPPVDGVRSPCP